MNKINIEQIKNGEIKITNYIFKNVLISDKDVILALLEADSDNQDIKKIMNKIEPSLFSDIEFCKSAVAFNSQIIPRVSTSINNNREFWTSALISSASHIFKYLHLMPAELSKDVEMLEDTIGSTLFLGEFVKLIHPDLISDKDIVLKFLEKRAVFYKYIPQELKEDKDCQKLALRKNGTIIKFIPEYTIDLDLMKFAVNHFPFALLHGPKEYRTNEELILMAIMDELYYPYIYEENKSDKFLIELIEVNPPIMKRVLEDCSELREDKDFLNKLADISIEYLEDDPIGYANYMMYKREHDMMETLQNIDQDKDTTQKRKI